MVQLLRAVSFGCIKPGDGPNTYQGQGDLKADQLKPNGNVADCKGTDQEGILYTVGSPAAYNYFTRKTALRANVGEDTLRDNF